MKQHNIPSSTVAALGYNPLREYDGPKAKPPYERRNNAAPEARHILRSHGKTRNKH